MKTARLLVTGLLAIFVASMLPVDNALAVDYQFDFQAPTQGAVGPMGDLIAFHTTIANTGASDDTYHITMEETLPSSWGTSLCVGAICYPPFLMELDVAATAGEVLYLDVDVTPVTDPGMADIIITVTSTGDPSRSVVKKFKVVSEGVNVLLVDADTNDEFTNDFYTEALAGSDKSVATWDRSLHGALSTSDMEYFDALLWFAGNSSPGLVDADLNALVGYLQLGGNAIFSGQNLAYDIADPASPYYSASSTTFMEIILGVGYAANNTGGTGLDGVLGDIITEGETFVLGGGTGNDMNTSPDALFAVAGGASSLTYSPGGETAAVFSTYGLGKTYFMGFGLENIASLSGRSNLLNSILAVFDGATPAFDIVSPILAGSLYAAPNPFNPQTSIKFEVGGTASANAEIVIFDVRGHVVRNLFKGNLNPGSQNMVWNGRNDQGQVLSTGLYMARVQVGQESEVVKMTLAK